MLKFLFWFTVIFFMSMGILLFTIGLKEKVVVLVPSGIGLITFTAYVFQCQFKKMEED